MKFVLYEVEDYVATLTLNRPDKLNAFTPAMLAEWETCLEDAQRSDDVRVLILTGAGRAFCAGADLTRFQGTEDPGSRAYQRKLSLERGPQRIALAVERLHKPLLVAVNGVASGAGMDMALMGDIRLAARSARFAESYVRLGLIAGDGGAWYLPRIVGLSRALELLWTGRSLDAEEAHRIGLVTEMVEDDKLIGRTQELASMIAAQPPLAVQLLKRSAYQAMSMDLRTHLDQVSSHMAVIAATTDHAEAMVALKEKRSGRYIGR